MFTIIIVLIEWRVPWRVVKPATSGAYAAEVEMALVVLLAAAALCALAPGATAQTTYENCSKPNYSNLATITPT